ncbi:ubiquitin carboxyl-terminal hydrolase 2-like [Cynara cardunculus var. scolymus]|uniref:ubiquitinyl hydrolase 1 n=1 Tax=Cynara cardunculus var. scolymus TaxID=59895 RepID=A0A118JTL5_CYNCS|nr:ubiquitin carboxyl-terminal hydrolase 2-like [Cynara cardunculus var. scolymus]XP_024986808.1 ubiquitin carboxyl-terminal hydrolase 2-like [Cynara cardunculus var. scolymus]KVH90984.1 Peptidase C19, ubiquitin carboxyl-terminal hydrolase 2 [Cynara cardunculus var. scolymus]
MGKRVKKKSTRNAQKEKQFSTSSPKNVSQKIIPTMVVDGVSVVKEARVCPHLDTGVNLDKISSKIASLESLKCDDCREGVVDRRASKVKGKHGKKKASGSASESKSIWVCLECGHCTCGGVGLPTTPQSHATRHAKQNHHPLAVQFANPNLRWCFTCNTLIPVQTSEENGGEQKDALSDIVKLLKARSSSENSFNVEDVWFGSGDVTREMKSVSTQVISENSGGYMVKGLVNLGNTCFFNSILQNLLAMDKLRDYFLRLEEPVGSLSVSLKKLFVETNPLTSAKNVINPQSLFNSVCAMAPQFRGYQQQDSHELLRFLLDGICNEESGVQNSAPCSERESTVPKQTPTFVDAIFGGQTSSSVSCLECGHTSIVYEPYLDLSLPLPAKKSPSKRMPSVSRSRKTKPPPKRRGKFGTKTNRASNASPADGVPIIATTSDYLPAEKKVVPSGDSTQPESAFLGGVGDKNVSAANENVAQGNAIEKISEITIKESGIPSDNLALIEPATVLNSHGNRTVDSSDILSWLDYLEPTMVLSNHDAAACPGDDMVTEYTGKTQLVQDEPLLQQMMEASKQVYSLGLEETPPLADDSWLDYLQPSSSSNGHIMASQNEDSSVVQNSGNNDDVFWENEQPLKVQESEIILLSYEELIPTSNGNEATLSSVSYEQEPSDFDGFGGLFDEPEVVAGPTVGPLNGYVESGPMARNISESDSDEVDNTNSQVSVDKCLTYFTTSELLKKTEHAWQCEQCSKALLEQRMRLKNKLHEPISNGAKHRIPSIPSVSNGIGNPVEVSAVLGNSDENSWLHDKSDCSRLVCELEERGNVVNGGSPELSQHPSSITASSEESCIIQDTDSCQVNKHDNKCKNEKVEQRISNCLARRRDFNGVEDEEVNSSSVKVTRDASKRILINRVPPILTIHLKRLSQDARGCLSKLNGHVDFKDTIDLKPYMDPSCCRDGGECRYRLIGVVEHLGTMRGGHYVAYVRGGAKGNDDDCLWYHTSDAHVREVSLEEVLQCEAYILFYEEM